MTLKNLGSRFVFEWMRGSHVYLKLGRYEVMVMGSMPAELRVEHPRCSPRDSNSTWTESSVAIRPDPEAQAEPTAPKATVHNGDRLITRPGLGKGSGLKILQRSRYKAARSTAGSGNHWDQSAAEMKHGYQRTSTRRSGESLSVKADARFQPATRLGAF